MPSIKVLAISPYPGMVPLLTETAKEYDGLELTISVGDLAKGLELAQKGFHANFDVIISRAGVAPFGYLFLCGCVVKTPSGVLILDRNA